MSMKQSHIILIISGLLLWSCMEQVALFEIPTPEDTTPRVGNFYAVNIFEDHITNELWFSEEPKCLQVKSQTEHVFSGEGALHIQWDKGAGDCEWLGVGIGWNNWSGKNLGSIYDISALQFWVRTEGRPMKSIPGAIGLEDHGGAQAWVGFSRKMIQADQIDENWTQVTIPILAFNWKEQEADVSNLKQVIIQFEASGDMYLDQMQIVESDLQLRSRAEAYYFETDRSQKEVTELFDAGMTSAQIEDDRIMIAVDPSGVHVVTDITDDTPLQNRQKEAEVWNGDALEIAFSFDPSADVGRAYYRTTDRQIGIRATQEAHIWDWKRSKSLNGTFEATTTESGYRTYTFLSYEELEMIPFEPGQIYGLEIAVDKGTNEGRVIQNRWNNPDAEGFHTNPSLWGEMKIVQPEGL
ncbi:MAG: hypothetical protein HKN79_08335 [Flavobacteriales bacterium]|nr:hypothetical protein [Flavobacteriales bacterium]